MKNELLPTVQKDNIIKKIINFLKKLFKKEKVEIKNYVEETNDISEEKNKFLKDIKLPEEKIKEIRDEKEQLELINKIEKDSNILNELSLEKLNQINKYYDKLIEKEKLKLKKLTQNNYKKKFHFTLDFLYF